jgi:hypothetical protein
MATVVLTLSQPSQFESSQPLSQGHAAAPSSQAFASVAPISAVLALSAAPSPSRGRCLDSQRTRASASPANPADAAELQDENMHVSERQDEAAEEADAETDAEDSETLLEVRAPARPSTLAPQACGARGAPERPCACVPQARGQGARARSRKKRAARAETLTAPCACVPQTDEVMDKLRKMLRMRGRTLSYDLLRVMEAWLRCGSGPDTFTAARACSPSLLSATPPNVLRSLGILRGP